MGGNSPIVSYQVQSSHIALVWRQASSRQAGYGSTSPATLRWSLGRLDYGHEIPGRCLRAPKRSVSKWPSMLSYPSNNFGDNISRHYTVQTLIFDARQKLHLGTLPLSPFPFRIQGRSGLARSLPALTDLIAVVFANAVSA